ncbi:MAG: hypothetical protein IT372_26600 [Polyangiaceae bacterium]|nr:hypothetical protein [Polyangiaceae bacterium]
MRDPRPRLLPREGTAVPFDAWARGSYRESMPLRRAVAALIVACGVILAWGGGVARADGGAQGGVQGGVQEARRAAGGVVVVAVGEGAARAARALARGVYRDEGLRPALDDASAKVLAGGAPEESASAAVKELAEVRGSVERAGSEVVARRLLASIGAQVRATLVIAVSMEGGRPVARVLRVATASYAPVELGATILGPDAAASPAPQEGSAQAASPADERSYEWPGANAALHGLLGGKKGGGKAVGPVATRGESAPLKSAGRDEEGKEVWKSPWFGGAIGVVAAVGVTVFVLAKTSEGDSGTMHLTGRIAP